MQTAFTREYLKTAEGKKADSILRACVHCGFCTATCPTFLLTGNELDSPRGRIYLIKEVLEGAETTAITRRHLDRCLTCQSCETTCPSDVQYHELLNIGRRQVESRAPRSRFDNLQRYLLRTLLTNKRLFTFALRCGQFFRPLLPSALGARIPARQQPQPWPGSGTQKPARMVLLNGCVQNCLSPDTNTATAKVLDKLGVQVYSLDTEGCCGALAYHMNAQEAGVQHARQLIDLLCEQLDAGAQTIISTASGCGNFIKGYADLLAADETYAGRAQRVASHTRDLCEVMQSLDLGKLRLKHCRKLAFQSPCSLQHGQRQAGVVEDILRQLDFSLSHVSEPHLCCGSAGTYSIFQPELASQLRSSKIAALEADSPEAIATANIGCQMHLAPGSTKTVKHWIEYIAEAIEQE